MRAVGREKQLLENQFCREEKRDGGSCGAAATRLLIAPQKVGLSTHLLGFLIP